MMYDGPFELFNVDFINFSTTSSVINSPIGLIGGTNKYSNLVEKISFSPRPLSIIAYNRSDLSSEPWRDIKTSQALIDLDGSFSQSNAGRIIVDASVAHPLEGCVAKSEFSGLAVCPSSHKNMVLNLNAYNSFSSTVPFIVRRTIDDQFSQDPADWSRIFSETNYVGNINRLDKFRMNTSIKSDYEYLFSQQYLDMPSDLRKVGVSINATYIGVSPVIKFINYGNKCQLVDTNNLPINPQKSLSSLVSLNDAGFYSDDQMIAFKVKTETMFRAIKFGSRAKEYEQKIVNGNFWALQQMRVICDEAKKITPVVKGNVDSIVKLSDGRLKISGYSCDYSLSSHNTVDLFIGVLKLATVDANLPAEAKTSFLCADPSTSPHGFNIILDQATATKYKGLKFTVKGNSISGGASMALSNSAGETW